MAIKPKDVPRQIQSIIKQELRSVKLKAKRTDLTPMGKSIISEMKNLISKGVSPILGRGRFAGYKKSYKKAISRGRGDFRSKRPRPVNLKLSGKFLKALKFQLRKGAKFPSLRIGFFKKTELQKERGHRAGQNKQRKRPVVPQGKEQFAARIQRIIKVELDKIAKKLSR